MSVDTTIDDLDLHPNVKKELEKIPNFLEVLLIMPQNPSAITEKINNFRKIQARKDENKLLSLHEYYSGGKVKQTSNVI